MAAGDKNVAGGYIDVSGSWVDLLGDIAGAEVVLCDSLDTRARQRLESAGAIVRAVDESALLDLPAGAAAAIVTCGLAGSHAQVRQLGRLLRPNGLLLFVVANTVSPLRLLDRVSERRPRGRAAHLPALRRRLNAANLPVRARFGILRSIEAPVTFFELDHVATASVVLASSSTRITGARKLGINVLKRLLRRGRAEWAVPGIALLCSPAPLAYTPPLGQVALQDSWESKLLYGQPVTHLDKRYANRELAAAEADVLEAVGEAWPGLAPELIARLSPTSNRLGWTTGRTLSTSELSPEQGRAWVLQAASLLGQLQSRLGHSQGAPVRIHGDFWLGNLLVNETGSQIVGVIDWSEATWGSADHDLTFLVTEYVGQSDLTTTAADELFKAARRARDEAAVTPRPA